MSLDETDDLQATQEARSRTQQIPPEVETFTPIRHQDIAAFRRTANSLQDPSLKRVAFQKHSLELGSSRFTQATSSLRNVGLDRMQPIEINSLCLDFDGGWDATAKVRFKQKNSGGTWDSQSTGSPGIVPAGDRLNMTFKDLPAVVIDEGEGYHQVPRLRCSELDGCVWDHHASNHQAKVYSVSDGLLRLDNQTGFIDSTEGNLQVQNELKNSDSQNHFTTLEVQNATLHTPNFAVAHQKGNIIQANGSAIRREDPEGLKAQSLNSNLVRNCYKNLQLIEPNKPKQEHRRLEPKGE